MTTLEFIRRNKNLSQTELGELIGYSGGYISGIEKTWHRPSEKFMKACSQFFSIPAKELFREVKELKLKHHLKELKDNGKSRSRTTKRRKR